MKAGAGVINFSTPAAGFDQPLAMWQACHERVLRSCALLKRLQAHIEEHGVDDAAAQSATSVLRYFNEAAPLHHQDEEEDLFPRVLQRLTGEGHDTVAQAIDQLRTEHTVIDADWATLKPKLQAIAQGETAVLERAHVAAYVDRYSQHIALEETVLAPAMELTFNAAIWKAIGRAMAARRGVDWAELGL